MLFFILNYFLHFYLPNTPKHQNQKKKKKNAWRYHHFTQVYQKSRSYAILFLRYMARDQLFFILGYFLAFYPPNSPKNQNLKKWRKKAWRCHYFTYVYQKLWSGDVRFLRYGAWQTDRQKKWHIEVGAPPKNHLSLKRVIVMLMLEILWQRF